MTLAVAALFAEASITLSHPIPCAEQAFGQTPSSVGRHSSSDTSRCSGSRSQTNYLAITCKPGAAQRQMLHLGC